MLLDARAHLVSVIDSCADIRRLEQAVARAVASGLWHDTFVSSRAVAAALTGGDIHFADVAFAATDRPSAFAYNVLIRAHSAGPTPSRSLILFRRMLRSSLHPDRFSLPFLLRSAARSAADTSAADAIHAVSIRHGLSRDPHVGTSLLHCYASSGRAADARAVFDEMPDRTTVTFNAIITASAGLTGLSLLGDMLSGGVQVNAATLAAALSRCAAAGSLAHGRTVHGIAARRRLAGAPEICTGLVHMYARCGALKSSMRAFEGAAGARDASTWTAAIGALAAHGRGEDAVALFGAMARAGAQPDGAAATAVLHACAHSGLVHAGIRVFEGIGKPRVEHYGAVVDMLGRAGRPEAAERVVASMPLDPNRAVWGALINACWMNGKLGPKGELEKQPLGLGFEVGESNMYAREGRWKEVGRVRERMVERGVKKERGFSSVELKGRVHKFLVGDISHPLTLTLELHRIICELMYLGDLLEL